MLQATSTYRRSPRTQPGHGPKSQGPDKSNGREIHQAVGHFLNKIPFCTSEPECRMRVMSDHAQSKLQIQQLQNLFNDIYDSIGVQRLRTRPNMRNDFGCKHEYKLRFRNRPRPRHPECIRLFYTRPTVGCTLPAQLEFNACRPHPPSFIAGLDRIRPYYKPIDRQVMSICPDLVLLCFPHK